LPDAYQFKFIKDEVTDGEINKKKIELVMPLMKIFNNGNELRRVPLTAMDLVHMCEHGLQSFSEPYLFGGEPMVPPSESSDDEESELGDMPVIELHPLLDNSNFKFHTWDEIISYKLEDFDVEVSNYAIKYMRRSEYKADDEFDVISTKHWTFGQFYRRFYEMQKDSEREMASEVYLKEIVKVQSAGHLIDCEEAL
jgi:hypothetical protein